MFVVLVDFRLHDNAAGAFLPLMHNQARQSLDLEPDCSRFDICILPDDENRVVLYEIYTSKEAFDAHLASDHFATFDRAVAGMVKAKDVTLLRLARP